MASDLTDRKNAKCRHLKNLPILRQVFICLRPPPLLGFYLGWSSNFLGSESGQIQSVKLLQNMVSNTTQHPPPPPRHTLSCIYCTLTQGWGGGEVNYSEKVIEAIVHKARSKYQHDCISSL